MSAPRDPADRMPKLIQICASQNDLFGLDADGNVHQYNFNTSRWMELGRGRSGQSRVPSGDEPATAPSARSEGQRIS
jgi:hypothetical protein